MSSRPKRRKYTCTVCRHETPPSAASPPIPNRLPVVSRSRKTNFGAILTCSVLGKRIPERTLGRCRAAGHSDHVDEGPQRGRDLPVPGIVKKQSLERWRPVFQYADQLARTQERLGQSLESVCDPQPVDRRANSQIGIIHHHSPIHRDPSPFPIPLAPPH